MLELSPIQPFSIRAGFISAEFSVSPDKFCSSASPEVQFQSKTIVALLPVIGLELFPTAFNVQPCPLFGVHKYWSVLVFVNTMVADSPVSKLVCEAGYVIEGLVRVGSVLSTGI